jgi:opacity protein-like surface antigen
MRHLVHGTIAAAAARFLAGTLLLAILVSTAAATSTSPGLQIIPSVGLAKSTDSNGGDAKVFGGLALRAALLPFLSVEGSIAYRDQSYFNDELKVRMWPVSASLWLTPVPAVYAGGGIGWYRTTYDLQDNLLFKDTTTDKIGLHLGGGVALPLTPSLGLDLGGRYIFMQKDNELEWPTEWPTEFNPDFWSAQLGLAIKF